MTRRLIRQMDPSFAGTRRQVPSPSLLSDHYSRSTYSVHAIQQEAGEIAKQLVVCSSVCLHFVFHFSINSPVTSGKILSAYNCEIACEMRLLFCTWLVSSVLIFASGCQWFADTSAAHFPGISVLFYWKEK